MKKGFDEQILKKTTRSEEMKDNQLKALKMENLQKKIFVLMNLTSVVTIIGYGSHLFWTRFGDGFSALAQALS